MMATLRMKTIHHFRSVFLEHELFDIRQAPKSTKELELLLIDYDTFKYYNNKWHSRMPKVGGFYISGLFFALSNGDCFGVAAWSQPIAANRLKDGFNALELRRMALPEDAPRNTATRFISLMTKYIKKNRPSIKYLLSYQDTGCHLGTIYKAANWHSRGESKFISWTTDKRIRAEDQSASDKVRWEYRLREK